MAERPLECSQCKKPIKVVYKEIVRNAIITTEMCADCPVLQERLYGHPPSSSSEGIGEAAGLCCNLCHTTLESVITSNPLGCRECYEIFGDILVSDLITANEIPPRLQKILALKKGQPIHIGKSPVKPINIPPSSRLTALNEALNEALKKENYEQAAWLRDQIKALMEKGDERKS